MVPRNNTRTGPGSEHSDVSARSELTQGWALADSVASDYTFSKIKQYTGLQQYTTVLSLLSPLLPKRIQRFSVQ